MTRRAGPNPNTAVKMFYELLKCDVIVCKALFQFGGGVTSLLRDLPPPPVDVFVGKEASKPDQLVPKRETAVCLLFWVLNEPN